MKLPNIQILRAIAALAVVFYHTGVEASEFCTASGRVCRSEDWLGALGVSLFFIVSGFIMVVTSWNQFGRSGAPTEFMRRRISRIVPLYWILTTITLCGVVAAPWIFHSPLIRLDYLAGSYLFWPVLRDDGLVRPVMKLGWTLNYEMFFYVIFAVALMCKRLLGLALAVLALVGLMMLRASGVLSGLPTALLFWSDPIVINFVIGMFAGIFYMYGFRTGTVFNIVMCMGAVAGVFAIELHSTFMHSLPEDSFVYRSIIAAPMAMLFMAATFGPQILQSSGWARAALLLGDASYSLYLIHPFALRATREVWSKVFGVDGSVWMFHVVCISLAVFAGLLCYLGLERTMSRCLTGRGKSKAPMPIEAVAGRSIA
jgi:exopolysaccharide production protein ExoZ